MRALPSSVCNARGFPFFNLYKLAVIARGRRLIADVEDRAPGAVPSRAELTAARLFNLGFRHSRDDFPLGWQLAAVARVPGGGADVIITRAPAPDHPRWRGH